jgi:hypothetical protein
MATTLNEIELQFAHLPREEQLAVLERLVHQLRLNGVHHDGHPAGTISVAAADPRFDREWDGGNVDFRAAENDLLSDF